MVPASEKTNQLSGLTRKHWGKLENLPEAISPLSWTVVGITAMPSMLALFHPSAFEILIWVVGEAVGGVLYNLFGDRSYRWFDPAARRFFPLLDERGLETATIEEKGELLNALISFPWKRLRYVWLISYPKLLPVWIALLCFWDYPHSWTVQLSRIFVWSTLNIFIFNSLMFFEIHEFISSLIARLHRKYDWSEVFKRASWAETERSFAVNEATMLLATAATLFLAQWVIVSSHTGTGPAAARAVLFVGCTGLLAIGRIWYVSRRYHMGGLWHIIESLEGAQASENHGSLPLHSSRLLARFEQAVNTLSERLRGHERELSHWVSTRTEEQRFLALAEVSALVVHDLSSPLQAIRLAADQAMADRDAMKSPECLDRIVLNSSRSLELVHSLRTYLRASAPPESGAQFMEVHRYVMRILSTRFSESGFAKLACVVDPRLESVKLDISRADLIHVLMNLLGNSLENLFGFRMAEPRLDITLQSIDAGRVSIDIRDNGSGLTAERFEMLTGFALLVPRDATTPQSLGLRLVRRLVERYRGSLNVVERQAPDQAGTLFRLELCEAAPNSEGVNSGTLLGP